MDTLSRLSQEFGPAFLIMAVYSGELSGYNFSDWQDFDLRIDEWTVALRISRKDVACQWEEIFAEHGSTTAQQRGDAFNHAIWWWAAESSYPQHHLVDTDWQPSSEVQLRPGNTDLDSLSYRDVGARSEWPTHQVHNATCRDYRRTEVSSEPSC
jgi:hypothetical protein